MLTQCIALDHGSDGRACQLPLPGLGRTPMADSGVDGVGLDSREGAYAVATQDVPLRRPSEPEEIAAAVAWLLSDDASYLNGAVIPVDGGVTIVDVGDARVREAA